jgi:hypothetical protein
MGGGRDSVTNQITQRGGRRLVKVSRDIFCPFIELFQKEKIHFSAPKGIKKLVLWNIKNVTSQGWWW